MEAELAGGGVPDCADGVTTRAVFAVVDRNEVGFAVFEDGEGGKVIFHVDR